MKCPNCNHEFKDPARVKGGKASKRRITAAQQKAMQAARKGKSKS